MCDCLNDVVEVAVCVQAGALADDDAPAALDSIAAWARHDQTVDVAMARTAPVHFAVALINVPRGGAAARWLVAELERLLDVQEDCGLHPAWRAYGALWLSHLATSVGLHSVDPSAAAGSFEAARRHVDEVGGICPDALYAPPTPDELESNPYAWLDCDEPLVGLPEPIGIATEVLDRAEEAKLAAINPLVLGLRTMNSDDWSSWPTSELVRELYRPDNAPV